MRVGTLLHARNKGGGPRPVCVPDIPRSKHYSHYGRETWKGAHIVIGCDPHYHHRAPSTAPLPARLHPSRSHECPDIAARLRSSSAPCSWESAKDCEVAKQRNKSLAAVHKNALLRVFSNFSINSRVVAVFIDNFIKATNGAALRTPLHLVTFCTRVVRADSREQSPF